MRRQPGQRRHRLVEELERHHGAAQRSEDEPEARRRARWPGRRCPRRHRRSWPRPVPTRAKRTMTAAAPARSPQLTPNASDETSTMKRPCTHGDGEAAAELAGEDGAHRRGRGEHAPRDPELARQDELAWPPSCEVRNMNRIGLALGAQREDVVARRGRSASPSIVAVIAMPAWTSCSSRASARASSTGMPAWSAATRAARTTGLTAGRRPPRRPGAAPAEAVLLSGHDDELDGLVAGPQRLVVARRDERGRPGARRAPRPRAAPRCEARSRTSTASSPASMRCHELVAERPGVERARPRGDSRPRHRRRRRGRR